MKEVDFSIIIATRNRSMFLTWAINSIKNQGTESYEIIIVDDASDDETPAVVKEFQELGIPIKYFRNEVCCFAHVSRSIGLKHAEGKYVVFMDDDDFYTDNNFYKQVKNIFEDYSSVNSVIASIVVYANGEYGRVHDLKTEGFVENKAFIAHFNGRTKPPTTLCAAFRREALYNAGLFESKMVNDTCIYMYGIMHGDVYVINKPVAAYRIHENNISKSKFSKEFIRDCLEDKIVIYKKMCALNLLQDKKRWLYDQLSVSVYYFLKSSNRDYMQAIWLVTWVLIHGRGTQKMFLKRFAEKGIF